MTVRDTSCALLLIDFQRGFDHSHWGGRNNPMAEDNALRLLAAFRAACRPVFHVRHLSTEPNSPLTGAGAEFKDGFLPAPGEAMIEKTVNAAFIGTNLEVQLRRAGIDALTICGLTTPHCVSTTSRMAANLGFAVTLAHDACAAAERNADTSFDAGPPLVPEENHRAAIAHLHSEFAVVTSTDVAIAALSEAGLNTSGRAGAAAPRTTQC